MTEKDLPLEENEESTLNEESDDEEVLDDLFPEDADNIDEDAPVSRKELNDLRKGIQKLATQRGREKSSEQKGAEPVVEEVPSDDLNELFYAQIPKAELVKDDLKAIAKAKYGGSEIKAWKGESWIQDKATVLNDAKKEEEVNKSKISKPSASTGTLRNDFSQVKTESDVANLSEKDKVAFFKAQLKKEQA